MKRDWLTPVGSDFMTLFMCESDMNERVLPKSYDDIAPKSPEGEVDFHQLFLNNGPLELDIGFGRGRSLFSRMDVEPSVRLIGIEIKKKLAFQAEQKRQKRKLENLLVWSGDAVEILSRVVSKDCVDKVFVHFPDPWWKKRHQKRMLLRDSFFELLFTLMRSRGVLMIQTDVEERAHMFEKSLHEFDTVEIVKSGLAEAENPYGSISNREIRARADGLPFYRIIAQKRG